MTRTKSIYLAAFAVLLSPLGHAAPIVVNDASQLDFSGDFVYTLNFNGAGTQTVGDATFTNVANSGAGAPSGAAIGGFDETETWFPTNLGAGADNAALGNVLQTIIWGLEFSEGSIDLQVTAGNEYRLQLLYSEGCCDNRFFDVSVDDFFGDTIQGTGVGGSVWQRSFSQGYAHQIDFTASGALLNIDLTRPFPGTSTYDTNYIISGLTLERIATSVPEPGTLVPEPGTLALLGLGLVGMAARRRKTV